MVASGALGLLLPALVQAGFESSLLSAPWRPHTAGGCSDEACCATQCVENGHGSAKRTISGRLGCVGACLRAVEGEAQEVIEPACREEGFLKLFQSDVAVCGSEAGESSHGCLAGAMLGTPPLPVLGAASAAPPARLSPNSFFWNMDNGPEMEGRGFTWYTRIFKLFEEGHPLDLQMGMGGTWLKAKGVTYDVCPCGKGWGSDCCATQDCDCCGWLFQSFEGGPGYWGNELPTTVSKWRVGDSVGCYAYYTGSPLFQFGDYDGHDCGHMGLAQVSNQMLMLPDGITFDVEGMLGVGYVHTPLGKVNESDTRNFWSIVLDTENFAGPLAYFIPEFWALRPKGFEQETAHLGDYSTCPELGQGGSAFEWNTLETYKASNGVYKVPKMTLPYRNGRNVLMMNNRIFPDDSQITEPLEAALKNGKLDPASIMATGTGTARQCPKKKLGDARFGLENGTSFSVGTLTTALEDEECVWSVKLHDVPGVTESCPDSGDCKFPQYVDTNLQPIPETQAPVELQAQEFRTKTGSAKYDQLSDRGRTCLSQPGPASDTLYCAQTLKGGESSTWVGYKWYRFVDQPGLQQAHLAESEKSFLQRRIETLHKITGRTSRWMTGKRAVEEGLAIVDGAALVVPPAGLEHGYVPIALYEGFEKPSGCHTPPSSPTPPPSPPRPWTPPPTPPPPPPAKDCQGRCVNEGHCCVGALSSYNHPSCAMGCIIANHTSSLSECQQKCRDADNTCSWNIDSISMSNCAECPSGCDASDGVDECLFGCEHSDAAWAPSSATII